mgnify:CR=1 FL=1
MKIYTTDRPNNRTEERRKNRRKTKENKQGRGFLVCLAWLVLWQILSMAVGSELLLPGPYQTLRALGNLLQTSKFYQDTMCTLLRCAAAMGLSLLIGAGAAWCSYRKKAIRTFLTLPVSFFKSVPVMAVIIYVILLVTSDWGAVIVCFIMCFPIVYTNLLSGLDAVSAEYLELADVYELTKAQSLRLIYIPSLRPNFNAALRLTCGLSWKAVIAAEVLSIPRFSLGYEMLNAKYYLETANLFAYIAVIVTLSILFEKFVCRLLVKETEETQIHLKLSGKKHEHMPPPAIEISGICKSFESKSVLDGVSLELPPGSVTALSGPSGRGKTTLARLLLGFEQPDAGTIRIRSAAGKAAGAEAAILFQEDRLLPWLNVYDNMALSRINNAGETPDNEIRKIAEALELTGALSLMPSQLSGGMKHRAALGRTFLAEANLLILDEPFRGLDEALKDRIVERLWKKTTEGKTVLLISHNAEDCKKLSERIVSI